jgi:hypothetical protein
MADNCYWGACVRARPRRNGLGLSGGAPHDAVIANATMTSFSSVELCE